LLLDASQAQVSFFNSVQAMPSAVVLSDKVHVIHQYFVDRVTEAATRELLRFLNQNRKAEKDFLLGSHAQWHLLLYVLVCAMAFYNTLMKCRLSIEL